jgi:putative DNA primase/helicase
LNPRGRSAAAAHNRYSEKTQSNPTITVLAALDRLHYEQQREAAAERLGIRVSVLDKLVKQEQAAVENENTALPHWNVESWPEPVDGGAFLDSIKRVFRRYIVLPKDADIALALWVLHAWTMDAGDISPFLVLVSPTKRCGKTSVLIILFYLTPKSELASNITASSLFRYIEKVRPTLLIDEADSFVKDNEELRGVLNSGHTKVAANIIRNVEINGEHKPRRFSTWAAKAIATIRSLADTLEDRSVRITLQRKSRNANVERLRRRDTEEFQKLRSQAARWAADNFDKLVDPNPAVPGVLNDRASDNWRPLLAIADLAGGAWPEAARRAACLLSDEEQDGAVNVHLLRDIRVAFGDAQEIRSADLVTNLTADPERPWAEWRHGRPLTQKQLGGLLKPFCIISTTVHPVGLAHGKGYRRVDFEEAWTAYCPGQDTPSAQSGTSEACKRASAEDMGTTRDFRSVQEEVLHGSKNGRLSHSHAGLHACTDRKAGNGGEGHSDQEIAPPDADLGIPEGLRRCDHCGQPGTAADPLSPWDWPGRPAGVRLHGRCEAPWMESGK